jgi:hypothetical protein
LKSTKIAFLGASLAELEGGIELLSRRDDCTSRIVSAFIVSDVNDKAKAQRKEHLRSCVDESLGAKKAMNRYKQYEEMFGPRAQHQL